MRREESIYGDGMRMMVMVTGDSNGPWSRVEWLNGLYHLPCGGLAGRIWRK